MKLSTTLLYILSTLLVFICTLQRSKHEELFTEYNTLLLPVFTILGLFLLYICIATINHTILNSVILLFFVSTGYFTIISNLYYLYEFAEFEIEEKIYHYEMSSSEFSEILVDEEKKEVTKVKKRKKSLGRFIRKFITYLKNTLANMTLKDFIIYLTGVLIVIGYAITGNWLLADIISLSICFHTIREVKLDSVINGYTHLLILVIYDYIWVLYGEKLSTVMHDVDVPIKLVFPKYFHGYDMIGMGDIFIPALFIAVVKRFGEKKNGKNIYAVTFIGYCIGVAVTIVGIWSLKNPKPALLFVCPIMGIFAALYAIYLRKFKEFIKFKRT